MTDNGNELAPVDANEKRALMVAEARMRVGLVSELMVRNLLQEGTHYSRKGLFGGNSKPSLLLPGAEVIANALGVNIGMNCVQHEINNGPFPDGAPSHAVHHVLLRMRGAATGDGRERHRRRIVQFVGRQVSVPQRLGVRSGARQDGEAED